MLLATRKTHPDVARFRFVVSAAGLMLINDKLCDPTPTAIECALERLGPTADHGSSIYGVSAVCPLAFVHLQVASETPNVAVDLQARRLRMQTA